MPMVLRLLRIDDACDTIGISFNKACNTQMETKK